MGINVEKTKQNKERKRTYLLSSDMFGGVTEPQNCLVLYTNQDPTLRMNAILLLKKYETYCILSYPISKLAASKCLRKQHLDPESSPFDAIHGWDQATLYGLQVRTLDELASASHTMATQQRFHDFLIRRPRQTVTSFHAMFWSLRLDMESTW